MSITDVTTVNYNGNDVVPHYLFHYTSIQSLALILKNRTIRFNSLDKVDDLQEKKAADIENVGRYKYVSSWTDDSLESIPMWNMYASLQSGVRIKLPIYPFKKHTNGIEEISKAINMRIDPNSAESITTYIPLSEMISGKWSSPQAFGGPRLIHVEYTNDPSKLTPKIVSKQGNSASIQFGMIGQYKNVHWGFQSEWRYILDILPLNLFDDPAKAEVQMQLLMTKLLVGKPSPGISHYDMVIDDDAFTSMEITMSPKLSAGNRIILQLLVEKYNPAATTLESTLAGLI